MNVSLIAFLFLYAECLPCDAKLIFFIDSVLPVPHLWMSGMDLVLAEVLE